MKLVSAVVAAILWGSSLDLTKADDQTDARNIIDKAIAAAGGEPRLAKFKAQVVKGSFVGPAGENGLTYHIQAHAKWPGQFRRQFSLENPKSESTSVLHGSKGWFKERSGTRDMSPEVLYFHQQSQYVLWVRCRLPLKDKECTLSLAGELKVSDRDATGVRVTHKDHPDLMLFFDKQSGLLLKSERIAAVTRNGNVENKKVEEFYSEYADVEGVKVPMKVIERRDGKVIIQTTLSEVQLLEALDENLFAKP